MKIHVISGFLGAGKTTLINQWLPALKGNICIIENEFGDVSIDDQLFSEQIKIKRIHSGCICCNLKGSLKEGIKEIHKKYLPEHIIIEPSGVASLSGVLKVCNELVVTLNAKMGNICTIVDLTVFNDYIENFGYFYTDQVLSTSLVLFSYGEETSKSLIDLAIHKINKLNPEAKIVKESWIDLSADSLDALLSAGNIGSEKVEALEDNKPASQILESFSIKDPKILSESQFKNLLKNIECLAHDQLLRGKGFLKTDQQQMIFFNYKPKHKTWKYIDKEVEPGIIFIGKKLNKKKISQLFSKRIDLFNIVKGGENEIN